VINFQTFLSQNPKVKQQMAIVRIVWFAIAMSGVVVASVLPPTPQPDQTKMIFLAMAAMMAGISFVPMILFPKTIKARKLSAQSPEYAQAFQSQYFLAKIVGFALSESTIILSSLALAGVEGALPYRLLAFFILMGLHFPFPASAETFFRNSAS
jgi:hypothetical protein